MSSTRSDRRLFLVTLIVMVLSTLIGIWMQQRETSARNNPMFPVRDVDRGAVTETVSFAE